MRSSTPGEGQHSTLGESTYEFISPNDALLEQASDDDACTESIASTDGPTPDCASEFSEDEDDEDYNAVDQILERSICLDNTESHSQPRAHASSGVSAEDSTHTVIPSFSEGTYQESRQTICTLDEQQGHDADTTVGSYVLRTLSKESGNWFDVFDQYKSSEVRLVVKCGLSKKTIPTPDTYKIWYIGEPDRWLEKSVSSQIVAALTAFPSTSRSVMVQGQLQPYGPILDAQWCTAIHVAADQDERQRVTFKFENNTKITLGCNAMLKHEDRPDLVIINYPSHTMPGTDRQDIRSACRALNHMTIPYLELVAARCYGEGSAEYDSKSLVACIEARNDPHAEFMLQEVLVLDHYSFYDLDPKQLNRHLALISPHLLTSKGRMNENSESRGNWKRFPNAPSMSQTSPTQWLKVLIPLMTVVLLCFSDLISMAPLLAKFNRDSTLTPTSPNPGLSTFSPVGVVTSSAVTFASPSALVASGTQELTVVPPKPKSATRKVTKTHNKISDGFILQVSGDHHFSLKPTKDLAKSRKKPQLQIRVRSSLDAVPIRFNRTVSGDYVVELEQSYRFREFAVNIASYSTPLIQQNFTVMLGHNKSLLTELADSAKTGLEYTQTSFLGLSDLALDHLNTLTAKTREWSDKAQILGEAQGSRLRDVKASILQEAEVQGALIKEMQAVAWDKIQAASAPIRTSDVMLRARMNALRIRCQVEIATGISKGKHGHKESWACSKVKGHI